MLNVIKDYKLVLMDGILLSIPWFTFLDHSLRIISLISGIILCVITVKKILLENKINREKLKQLKDNDAKRENPSGRD